MRMRAASERRHMSRAQKQSATLGQEDLLQGLISMTNTIRSLTASCQAIKRSPKKPSRKPACSGRKINVFTWAFIISLRATTEVVAWFLPQTACTSLWCQRGLSLFDPVCCIYCVWIVWRCRPQTMGNPPGLRLQRRRRYLASVEGLVRSACHKRERAQPGWRRSRCLSGQCVQRGDPIRIPSKNFLATHQLDIDL